MKKLIIVFIAACMLLTSCNYQAIDLTYKYNYAYIQLQNGTRIEGHVESWRDYEDGEQIQVTINGVTYLTNSYNCTLVYDASKEDPEA